MRSNYIPKIDGLRAIAVIMVLLFHLNPGFFKGGFVGVDVFFVISGFVITNSLIGRLRDFASPTQFLRDFYVRRVRRILPALCFCLIITFALVLLLVPSNPSKPFLEYMLTGTAAIFGFSNLFLARQSLDYFGDLTEFNPFLQTWSLGVEEQFYFIMPLLFVLTFILHGKDVKRSITTMILLVGALAAYSFTVFVGGDIFGSGYYLITSRGWEISVGVLLALTLYLCKGNFSLFKRGKYIDLFAFFLLILCLFFRGKVFMIIGVFSALCVCASGSNFRLLSDQYLLLVGKASFSIYLWHWPVIWLARWTGIQVENPLNMLVLMVLIMVIGLLSYAYIEMRYKFRQHLIFNSMIFISAPFVLGVAGALSGLGFLPSFYVGQSKFGNVDEIAWEIAGQEYRVNNENKQKVILVGNSHARHLLPALAKGLDSSQYNIIYKEVDTARSGEELAARDQIIGIIKKAESGSVILISSEFRSLNGVYGDILFNDKLGDWRVFIEGIIQSAASQSVRVIFADNVNKFKTDFRHYQTCADEWFRFGGQSCESKEIIPRSGFHDRVSELVKSFSQTSANLVYLNLSSEFCNELAYRDSPCSNFLGRQILYRDSNHLTSAGSMLLSSALIRSIDGK